MKSQGPRVTVRSGRATLEKLTSGMHASSLQLACHGAIAGQDANRFSVLLLDAESGAQLDPGRLLSLPGKLESDIAVILAGSCMWPPNQA